MIEKDIHWFPGHMKKAQEALVDKIKIVDVVIEILDARAPFSSRNPFLEKLAINKPRLIILNKSDLAERLSEDKIAELKNSPLDLVVYLNAHNSKSYSEISKSIEALGKTKNDKYFAKGMKRQPIRAVIVGIPNVGKSTIINLLSKSNKAGVANTPGFTKGQQWIKVNESFELLDTPGILPSKYDDKEVSKKLALIGAIKEETLPLSFLCEELINILKTKYLNNLNNHFDIKFASEDEYSAILTKIAFKMGFISKNNEPNIDRCEKYLLKVFKNGELGKVMID